MTVNQLKKMVKETSLEKNIPHEVLYQNYFFERFLIRLSKSEYYNKFIFKKGFLISSILGIKSRSTVDFDMTVRDFQVTKDT